MNGKDFIANTRLTDTPGNVLAAIGETCELVPEASLAWLLKDGLIRPADGVVIEAEMERSDQPGDRFESFKPTGRLGARRRGEPVPETMPAPEKE